MIEARRELSGIEVGRVEASDREEAVEVIVRGMLANPVHIAAFGPDPGLRTRRLRRNMGAAFGTLGWRENMLAARDEDGAIVGVCGAMAPGRCKPTPRQTVRLLPAALANGPRAMGRMARWIRAWAEKDPAGRHWHLGPVAVDAGFQGMGVGSALLGVFVARMDAAGEDVYLETDKDVNVTFYEKFGFEVIGAEDVLEVPNWFMFRRAKK
jgi:ribosomal protein S18 acetylase RimI-like enzyme